MERIHTYYSLCLLFLGIPAIVCVGHPTNQIEAVQHALSLVEAWVDKTDAALRSADILNTDYGPWTECTATCGVGTKTRYKVGCTNSSSPECVDRFFCNARPCPMAPKPVKTRYATCAVRPNEELGASGTVTGLVRFKQTEKEPLMIDIDISGFPVKPSNADASELDHGFHVHQFGNIDGGCGSTGGHYNPMATLHGGPSDDARFRHAGDFGNIQQTPGGAVTSNMEDDVATLFGERSIIGRALVIHQNQDDLGRGGDVGSETTGNAGARLACCVIGLSVPWE